MSETQRFLDGLGLAARAGRLRVGMDAVGRSLRRGEVRAVVIAADAPRRVRGKLERLSDACHAPHRALLDGDQLGRAIGRERVVVVGVTDASLGRRVMELAESVKA